MALQDRDIIGHRGTAHVEDAADVGARQLHIACRSGELHRGDDMHRDTGRADRVPLRLQAA